MFQLLHYNNENGVTDIGYFKTLKDAHTVVYKSLNEGEGEKLIFPNFPDDVVLNNGFYYIYGEDSKEEAGICYFKTVLIWDDLDTAFYIVDLPPTLNLDSWKAEIYNKKLTTIMDFLKESAGKNKDNKYDIVSMFIALESLKADIEKNTVLLDTE